ncbi:MAG TPA: hypothetical protein DD626_00885 [Clostridiales bacterium]|nr:hypothetical protein [Clostridiales bacterium]
MPSKNVKTFIVEKAVLLLRFEYINVAFCNRKRIARNRETTPSYKFDKDGARAYNQFIKRIGK